MDLITIVIGLIAITALVLNIIGNYNTHTTRDYFKKSNDKLTQSLKSIPECRQGPQGTQGPSGPAGPQGTAGGTFLYRGILRNLQHTDLVTDRFFNNAAPYLTKQNYGTSQLWTMTSDNQLQNQYAGCLTGNTVTGQVTMDTCGLQVKDQTQNWMYTAEGQVRLMNTNQCLSVNQQNVAAGSSTIVDGGTAQKVTVNNLPVLSLSECENGNSIPANLRWSFV
jgi:hypothetical protein